jgi:hypothetical protein
LGAVRGLFRQSAFDDGFTLLTEAAALASKEFSEHVQEISANFCCIYNEAHEAEQLGLTQICGVGYRRALEFLIKDCLVSIRPDEKVRVKTVLILETTSPIQR